MTEPAYIIGIDLGTTNSVVAYTEAAVEKGKTPDIRVMDIPQLVDAGVVENRALLPSFILVPGKHDVSPEALALPWDPENRRAVGEFGRNRGAEIPHRLIASAKSWLCHTLVDRNEPILPWEGGDDVEKLSPVAASAVILGYIRDVWNNRMATEDEALRMEHQDILITVPASFDAVARELTARAAEMAGLKQVTLLEEPQAAFYAWIESRRDAWRDHVEKGDLLLVCDVGGGTSDFSLIRVDEADGDLALERVSVGDHLLVGGDNMDLALAYAVSGQFSGSGKKLDAWQMRSLWHTCRRAKEKLFQDADAGEYPITLLGRGSSLIGGTLRTTLRRETMDQVILNGFFPECGFTEKPAIRQRFGIQEAGLAYESDPAVTRHLAQFLDRAPATDGAGGDGAAFPTAVLFNGGVMKSPVIRKRVMDILNGWSGEAGTGGVREIDAGDFDLAVARGAAYYGLARKGEGIRIRGGLNRSYYIGVAAALPAVPGMPVPLKALCVAPFGMEEGTETALRDREFVLVVGEPVKFDFLGSSQRLDDAPGTVLEDWEPEVEKITTIETTLDGQTGQVIPVFLEVRTTEVGTLELWCVDKNDSGRRWKLEFNVREGSNG